MIMRFRDHTASIGEGWQVLLLTIFVFLSRLPFLNSPTVHIDEQFYLAVADKWVHHGLIPFVDIWDRKPLGTFIIYVLPAFFANGVLAYQIMAIGFVIATGLVAIRIGRILSFDSDTTLAAAVFYAVATVLMEGAGGQTPIFYNLFVAAAVLVLLQEMSRPDISRSVGAALLSCALFGVAIQIKYICAIEAAVLSIFYLIDMYLRRGGRMPVILSLAAGMIIFGILPTAAAALYYLAVGHFSEFADANFVSIFAKRLWHLDVREYFRRFAESSLFCVCFLPFAGYGLPSLLRDRGEVRQGRRVLLIWLAAALPGALGLGNPTRHYFLPTLVPLSLLAAFGWQSFCLSLKLTHNRYKVLAAILFVPVLGCLTIAIENPLERGEADDVQAVAKYIGSHTPQGACAFIFNRLPILYYLADVCAPSIYLFPNHLSEIAEVQTPGKERLAELQRVLKATPPLIYVRRPYSGDVDPEAIALLERKLEDDYALSYVRRGYRQFHAIYEPKAAQNGLQR
jgi:hypothetical protein